MARWCPAARRLAPTVLAVAVVSWGACGCSLVGPSRPSTTSAGSAPAVTSATTPTAAPTSAATRVVTTTSAAGPQPCASTQLTASLGAGGGAAAGHQYPYLVLTNVGSVACTVTGYPGVSFVHSGNGTQLGAPADRDASGTPVTTITLAVGQAAHSRLSVAQAGNYDAATCQPAAVDGVRVFPPDQTGALFVATTAYTGCANPSVKLLLVGPLQGGAA